MPKPFATSRPYWSAAAVLGLCFTISGAATGAEQDNSETAVTARMRTEQGEVAGVVKIAQLARGVLLVAELEHLPPGGHAFHVHERGTCQPDFKAAGGHYNPSGAQHGLNNEEGYHAGDLPNIYVSEQGTAKAAFFVPYFSLRSEPEQSSTTSGQGPFALMDQDGSSIMLHEYPDDYLATPPDSSGARIACGVLKRADTQ